MLDFSLESLVPEGTLEEKKVIQQIIEENSKIKNLTDEELILLVELRRKNSSTNRSESLKIKQKWMMALLYFQDTLNKDKFDLYDLKKIHSLIHQGSIQNLIGFRDKAVFAGGRSFPSPSLLEKLMYELFRTIDQIESPISQAAFSYQALCSIHPFEDGNGRVSRFLADFYLIRNGYSPLIFPSTCHGLIVSSKNREKKHIDSLNKILISTQWARKLFSKKENCKTQLNGNP
jgi:Fic family protein